MALKIGGIIVAAFIAGAYLASPELRAYAANTVWSSDIINNSIQSVDIKSLTTYSAVLISTRIILAIVL